MRGFSVCLAIAMCGTFYVVAWPMVRPALRAVSCFTGN